MERQDRRQGYWRLVVVGVLGILLAIISLGYVFELKWVGVVDLKDTTYKTLWDWLALLIVPAVLALGGYLFTRAENQRNLQIAEDRRQDDILQAYLEGMSQLLTDKDRPLHRAQVGNNLSTVARARTLTVLARLNGMRKGNVVRFLYEANLISRKRGMLALKNADLSWADLSDADLDEVDLSETNLRNANLHGTYLIKARLFNADLRNADLRETRLIASELERADLREANLIKAILTQANLTSANLSNANLRNADLVASNLYGIKLTDADLSGARLSKVKGATAEDIERQTSSIEGAVMPNPELEAFRSYAAWALHHDM